MLTLHRAERAGPLADALAELLSTPLDDPFSAEVVAVPAKGVERWLAQRLAARLGAGASGEDGVAANLRFPSPGRLVDEAVAAAGGAPEDDPWAPGRVLWTLLDVVDASLGEPWCACLAAHLGAPAGVRGDGAAGGPAGRGLVRRICHGRSPVRLGAASEARPGPPQPSSRRGGPDRRRVGHATGPVHRTLLYVLCRVGRPARPPGMSARSSS